MYANVMTISGVIVLVGCLSVALVGADIQSDVSFTALLAHLFFKH